MRFLLPLCLVLLATPAWGQETIRVPGGVPCTVSRPAKGDTRLKCGDMEVGLRDNPDGSRDHLRRGRGWKGLGIVKTWKVERRTRPEDFPPDADPVRVSLPVSSVGDVPVPDGTTIVQRVGIFWTPEAESRQGGLAAMQAHVALLVAITNEGYANSAVDQRIELAVAHRVEYVETTPSQDLSRLRSTTDGIMDEVHALRDLHGADIVTLLGVGWAGQGYCGLANLMGGNNVAFASTAFGIVDLTCGAGNLSYPHEVGHNQGLHHDPPTVCGQPTCNGHAFGHGFGSGRTIEAYPSAGGSRLRYFSNPSVLHNGNPTGIANQRDNARRLREWGATVAAFRPDPQASGAPPSAVTRVQAIQE